MEPKKWTEFLNGGEFPKVNAKHKFCPRELV